MDKGLGGVEVDLGFAVMSLGNSVDKMKDWWEKHSDIVYQSPINAQVSSGSAGITPNDVSAPASSNLQPDLGTCWSVRRLSVTGYTAGTVTLYINALEPVASWTFGVVNPFYTYAKGAILLQPGDRLTIGQSGVTGTGPLFGVADTFPYWYLRRYLD
jgi:hypothetical protein